MNHAIVALPRYTGPGNSMFRDGLPYATPVATLGRATLFVTSTGVVVVEYDGARLVVVDTAFKRGGRVWFDNPEKLPKYVIDTVSRSFDAIVALRADHL